MLETCFPVSVVVVPENRSFVVADCVGDSCRVFVCSSWLIPFVIMPPAPTTPSGGCIRITDESRLCAGAVRPSDGSVWSGPESSIWMTPAEYRHNFGVEPRTDVIYVPATPSNPVPPSGTPVSVARLPSQSEGGQSTVKSTTKVLFQEASIGNVAVPSVASTTHPPTRITKLTHPDATGRAPFGYICPVSGSVWAGVDNGGWIAAKVYRETFGASPGFGNPLPPAPQFFDPSQHNSTSGATAATAVTLDGVPTLPPGTYFRLVSECSCRLAR